MKKNNLVYLKQMVDYIEKIEGYVNRVSFKDFENNGLLQDGVMRNIELIGETARKLSPKFWEKYRNILPLAQAVSMRNSLTLKPTFPKGPFLPFQGRVANEVGRVVFK